MKKILLLSCSLIVCNSFGSLFYIGGHLNYVRLNFDNPQKLKGYLAGFDTGFKYTLCHFFAATDFEGYWNAGPVCGRPAQQSNLTEYLAKIKFGPTINISCNKTFEPYIGFGYNYFRNTQDPSVDGLSYKYNKMFIPVGFVLVWCPTHQLNVGLQAEWRPDVFANVHVLKESLEINKRQAIRVQLPISLLLGCKKKWDITMCPFFDWNKFGKTNTVNANNMVLPIPTLTRWYLGYRLEIGYSF